MHLRSWGSSLRRERTMLRRQSRLAFQQSVFGFRQVAMLPQQGIFQSRKRGLGLRPAFCRDIDIAASPFMVERHAGKSSFDDLACRRTGRHHGDAQAAFNDPANASVSGWGSSGPRTAQRPHNSARRWTVAHCPTLIDAMLAIRNLWLRPHCKTIVRPSPGRSSPARIVATRERGRFFGLWHRCFP